MRARVGDEREGGGSGGEGREGVEVVDDGLRKEG